MKLEVSVTEAVQLIHGYQVGQQITITYYRGNNKNLASLTLAPAPPPSST